MPLLECVILVFLTLPLFLFLFFIIYLLIIYYYFIFVIVFHLVCIGFMREFKNLKSGGGAEVWLNRGLGMDSEGKCSSEVYIYWVHCAVCVSNNIFDYCCNH